MIYIVLATCIGAALGCTFLAVIFACCRVSADAERRAERVVRIRGGVVDRVI